MVAFGRQPRQDEVRRIVEAHYADVLAYCRRHTGSSDEAQDAAQETFLRFVRSAPTYRDRGKPLAFLLTIARNVCVDAARAHARDWGELPEELPDPAAAAEGETEGPSGLASALRALSRPQRELLELRFGQELKVGEVARMLGVSRFVVSRRISAALEALRAELRRTEEGLP